MADTGRKSTMVRLPNAKEYLATYARLVFHSRITVPTITPRTKPNKDRKDVDQTKIKNNT